MVFQELSELPVYAVYVCKLEDSRSLLLSIRETRLAIICSTAKMRAQVLEFLQTRQDRSIQMNHEKQVERYTHAEFERFPYAQAETFRTASLHQFQLLGFRQLMISSPADSFSLQQTNWGAQVRGAKEEDDIRNFFVSTRFCRLETGRFLWSCDTFCRALNRWKPKSN